MNVVRAPSPPNAGGFQHPKVTARGDD
jgi:hypothetical protein